MMALQGLLRLASVAAGAFAAGTAGDNVALVDTSRHAPLSAALRTEWRLVDPRNATAADFESAVALIPPDDTLRAPARLSALMDRMPAGRLLQWSFTGTELLNMSAVPGRFAVCDVHQGGVSIPEYVMAAVLSWNIQLPQVDAEFRSCTWHAENTCQPTTLHRSAKGQTIGIVGYGVIGTGVALRAAAFGMRVVAVTYPVPASPPAPLAWVGGDDMLPQLMEEADFVVVACPLNAATKGLIGASAIARMKPQGVLVNIARGAIVDEAALFQALSERKIGGAVLDVWWRSFAWLMPGQMWPSEYNFSALPNVWMTSHMSGATQEAQDEDYVQMASNFDALATGQALKNVIRNATHSMSYDYDIDSSMLM